MILNLLSDYLGWMTVGLLAILIIVPQLIISRVNRTRPDDQKFPRLQRGIPLGYIPSLVHPRSAVAAEYRRLYPRTHLLMLNRALLWAMLLDIAAIVVVNALRFWMRH